MYFEAILLLLFTTWIEEVNFWWEILLRMLNTTPNDGKLNLNIGCHGNTGTST